MVTWTPYRGPVMCLISFVAGTASTSEPGTEAVVWLGVPNLRIVWSDRLIAPWDGRCLVVRL